MKKIAKLLLQIFFLLQGTIFQFMLRRDFEIFFLRFFMLCMRTILYGNSEMDDSDAFLIVTQFIFYSTIIL